MQVRLFRVGLGKQKLPGQQGVFNEGFTGGKTLGRSNAGSDTVLRSQVAG
jgi:hypothetical protein